MRTKPIYVMMAGLALCLVVVAGAFSAEAKKAAAKGPEWSMNATVIEACSCAMFCQCYFNASPGGHEGHHYCKFNNAYKINHGHYGDLKLDGAKFWISGDLGGDFSKGQMDWGVMTFDKDTTKGQRDAIQTIASHLFPVKWNSMTTSEGEIVWNASKDQAHALLDGGQTAEVQLQQPSGVNVKGEPVVIKNLKYWGAPRNDGFILMPNVMQAYRKGDKAYETKGTNGFMLTIDIDSKTAPPAAAM